MTEKAQEHKGGVLHQEQQIKWHHLDPTKFLVYNVALHAVSDLLLYPPDTVRTRLQVQDADHGVNHRKMFPQYKNTLHSFQLIWQHEGLRGFYKGFLVAEINYVLGNIFHYTGYEILKEKLQNAVPRESSTSKFSIFWTTFLSGALADLVSMIFVVPSEVIQQRLQIQSHLVADQPAYRGGWDAAKKIYREHGIRGLYRGSGATILLNVPASAIWWSSYELLKNTLHDLNPRKLLGLKARQANYLRSTTEPLEDEDPLIQAISAGGASTVTRLMMNPIDVAKTRLQTQDITALKHPVSHTTLGTVVWLLRNEGAKSLWKGLVPSMMASVPAAVISIIIYEYAKKKALKSNGEETQTKT